MGRYDSEEDAAIVYDTYVIKNNLPNPLNFNGEKTMDSIVGKEIRRARNCSSKYNGVSFIKTSKRWRCVVTISQSERISIGCYLEEVEAAKAYDKFIVENNLDRKLNFPEDYPNFKKDNQ